MTDVEILILALLSVFGALFSAVLGWLDSGEPFDARKMASSLLRAVIAGFLAALGFSTLPAVGIWDYIVAFLTGAGIDTVGNRAAGAVVAKLKPKT
jgi:hypothetical protein